EAPTLLYQLARQPLQQFGVRRLVALQTKVARRIDDATPEMMLPQAIDNHSRQEMPRTLFDIAQPVAQRAAEIWRPRASRRFLLPAHLFVFGAHQHLQKALRDHAGFLVGVPAFEKMRTGQKIAPLTVQANRRQPFGAYHRLEPLDCRPL